MTTLSEIEAAAKRLTPDERRQLLLLVAQSLRSEGVPLPPPREFTKEEMQGWMDEDEADMRKLRGEARTRRG